MRFHLSVVSYERILSIENLNDVPNPWKGFTMNRCLVVALVVLLVSSGVNEVHGECSPSLFFFHFMYTHGSISGCQIVVFLFLLLF